jgi:hypothetical protein
MAKKNVEKEGHEHKWRTVWVGNQEKMRRRKWAKWRRM